MEAGDLPQEILIDIFSRLPLKSVGKCRCLAKLSREQLSTPQFIKSHLTRKTHQENIIFITTFDAICSTSNIKDDTIWKELPGPGPGRWTDVVGTCDGLVLLVYKDYEKFLMNPITLQQVKVANSPLALNRRESVSMHGFGYDSSSDDYKVVTLSSCQRVTFVDVYSVKRGVWKRVGISPYYHGFPYLPSWASFKKSFCPGAFVNGAITLAGS
ncbi:UNVERIFIED_CONTAM: F-box protein DOR [Sesamum radiatum]|uniref:F-box protein DOR n=1 Tax=Sesamum radiatum TaxID=300843 RepID=A0AAW2UD32_SESRA